MRELNNKTVLLLSPLFFGYEIDVKNMLEELGARVIFFDEKPSNNFFTKVMIRLNYKYPLSRLIRKYYSSILDQIRHVELDYVFLLNPETVPLDFLDFISRSNPGIKTVTYFWDSIFHRKKSLIYLPYSDRFFSFDLDDSKKFQQVKFLPLFFSKEYEAIAKPKSDFLYSLSFIGTVHSDRYHIIAKIREQLAGMKINTYFYFYSPSMILFLLQKLFLKSFRSIKLKDVSFNALSKTDVIDIVSESKCIVDIHSPDQSGLTMRAIEALGAKRKLVTTNNNVKCYDFFDDKNVFVFSRSDPIIIRSFLEKDYVPIEGSIYKKYSLAEWVKVIFEGLDA